MPKKKKDKKKTKKGKDGEEGKPKEAEPKDYQPPGISDKGIALKNELDDLNTELSTLKKQVDDLRKENEWLQDEAEKTKAESQDYQTYVSRKALKRQSLIVSLSDYNQQQLREIESQREELVRDYEEKRTGLNATLLEKESELSRIQKDLKSLQPYMDLQREQDEEIGQLERQLEEMRFCHEDRIRALKTRFIREKRALEEASEDRIRTMANQANKQASDCLNEHTQRIRTENQLLRRKLQELIAITNDLQLQKKKLDKQYQALLRERQCSQDLQQMRGSTLRNLDSGSGYNFGPVDSGISLPQVPSSRR